MGALVVLRPQPRPQPHLRNELGYRTFPLHMMSLIAQIFHLSTK